MYKGERVGAIIVAAGESRRMNGLDKLFAPLADKPVIVRTVNLFQTSEFVDDIVLVMSRPNIEVGRQLAKNEGWTKITGVVAGGERRQDSVSSGIKAVKDCPLVVIHDGARPLMPRGLILSGLMAAEETGSAVAAVPVTDTVKVVVEDMLVKDTPPRRFLWSAQTPQVFRHSIIFKAYLDLQQEATDDSSLVEHLGFPVKLFMGSRDNIKITTPSDIIIAEALWRKRGSIEL